MKQLKQTAPLHRGSPANRTSEPQRSLCSEISGDIVLEARDLTKKFSGFTAVDRVNLAVRRGGIHALIGPNGAGKTTLFNLLTKAIQPTSGQIFHEGQEITHLRPAAVACRGMVRSFQISAIFGKLSVRDNVRIALQRPLGISYGFWKSGAVLRRLDAHALELLDSVGLSEHCNMVADTLAYGQKRALEIATTLALDPSILLLDEPTSGLGHEDIDRIAGLVKTAARGRTVLMVEHNLSVVSGLASSITVLARGQILAAGSYDEVSRNPAVVEAYLGSGHETL